MLSIRQFQIIAVLIITSQLGSSTTTPTPAPSPAPCQDDDATASTLTGYGCATLAYAGYCDSYLCPDCAYAGMCDQTCDYCPTPAPSPAPCQDDDATASALTGYECATLAYAGYCGSYLCPDCAYAGMCDQTCDYCPAEDADSVSVAPTTTPPPSTSNPTAMPTTVPTISAPPSSSLAPTLTGSYEVSTDTELRDQIAVAEEGREWTLTVTDDFSVNRTFVIPRFKHIKVIGSSRLGRRARFTKGIVNSDPWDDDLCFKLHNSERDQGEASSYAGDFNAWRDRRG